MKIYSLTKERIDKYLQVIKQKEVELENIKRKSPAQMWIDDLETLEQSI
jgi:hypothetical protein